MAQATGTGESPSPQPVHPIHQETATHEALTKWVSENEDNDPHEGTDLEVPQEEAKTEEPKAEVVETEEVEKVEFDEETPIFDIEYKTDSGKEQKKLSLKELREGWMAKQDYHRNIQKVKAQEAEIESKTRQAQLAAQQEYVQRLEIQKQAITKLAGVKTMEQIEQLSREDPAAAQQEFLRMISVNQTYQTIEAEQRQAQEKLQNDQRAAFEQAKVKARQTLESDIPGWGEELYGKVLGTVAKEYGFQNEEVAPVVDARLIKLFHDAYQYRTLQKAKPEISKKVVAVPKVVKPGSAQSQNTSNEVQELSARLKKTGSGEDFVALYLAQQKQQKRK